MLTEEAGDGDGQRAQAVVVDDSVGPRIFLPRGQKVEDADGGNCGRGQRQRNPAIRLEYVGAVDPCGVHDLTGDVLHKSLDHEGREGDYPCHIERNQSPQPVDQPQARCQLELRNDHRRSGDDHRHDDEAEQQLRRPGLELAQHKRHRRGYRRRKSHRGQRHHHRVQEVQIELALMQDVIVVFQRQCLPFWEKARRILVQRTVRAQRGGDHVDHRQREHDRPRGQQEVTHGGVRDFRGISALHGRPSPHSSRLFIARNCTMASRPSVSAITKLSAAA